MYWLSTVMTLCVCVTCPDLISVSLVTKHIQHWMSQRKLTWITQIQPGLKDMLTPLMLVFQFSYSCSRKSDSDFCHNRTALLPAHLTMTQQNLYLNVWSFHLLFFHFVSEGKSRNLENRLVLHLQTIWNSMRWNLMQELVQWQQPLQLMLVMVTVMVHSGIADLKNARLT